MSATSPTKKIVRRTGHPFDTSGIKLPEDGMKRMGVTFGRSTLRQCPYCGGSHIFKNWWTLKKRCPTCNVLFEYEDGYSAGSYAINIIFTEFLAVGITIAFLIWGDLSVLGLQIMGATLGLGLPIFFYPYANLYFIALDLWLHHPGDFSERPRV